MEFEHEHVKGDSPENGIEYGTMDLHQFSDDVESVINQICPTSYEAWNEEPALRETVVEHLLYDHGLAQHHQVYQVLTMLEADHILRQVASGEEGVGVMYQRETP